MQLPTHAPEGSVSVSVSGTSTVRSFGLADNAKIYSILSNNLYQDKIGSVVREYSCNALDSHTEAGYADRPITIHLPDQFEPWFSVIDTGVGLSPERIADVFMIYGESTKDSSNSEIGAFGIGGKVGLAYSGAFSVTSVYDGKKYAYSMFLNDQGIPQMATMDEADTDAPNGVEIKVPVEPSDFYRFSEAVKVQLHHFPVKPVIENGNNFTWGSDKEAVYKSDNVILYNNGNSYNGSNSLNMIQGPVGYAINRNMLSKHLDTEDMNFVVTLWNSGGVDFLFNIGEISVVASRESVEFTHHTINSFKEKIAIVRKELIEWIGESIVALDTPYEKAALLNSVSMYATVMNSAGYDLEPFKRVYGRYKLDMETLPCIYEEKMREVTQSDGTVSKVKKQVRFATVQEYGMSSRGNTVSMLRDVSFMEPSNANDFTIILRDSGKAPVARIRHHINNSPRITSAYVIWAEPKYFTDKFIKDLEKCVGGKVTILRTSELPDAPRASSGNRSGYKMPTAYLYAGNGFTNDSVKDWERVYEKLDSGELTNYAGNDFTLAVYVTVFQSQIVEAIPYADAISFQNITKMRKYKDVPLFAVREKDVAKLDPSITWMTYKDFLAMAEAEIRNDMKVIRVLNAGRVVDVISNSIPYGMQELVEKVNSDTMLFKLHRINKVAERVMEHYNNDRHLYASFFAHDDPRFIDMTSIKAMAAKMESDLPLIAAQNRYTLGNMPQDHLVSYINHFSRA